MLPRKCPVCLAPYYSACNPSLQACCEKWVCTSFSSLHLVIMRKKHETPMSSPRAGQDLPFCCEIRAWEGVRKLEKLSFQDTSYRHSSGSGSIQAPCCWVLGEHNKEICVCLPISNTCPPAFTYRPLLGVGFWTGHLWF